MSTEIKYPFYAKASYIFIGIFAFIFILYIGNAIIVPVIYAGIIAIILNPIVNFLTLRRFNRVLAISISISIAILITVGLLYFIISQVGLLQDTFPKLKEKSNEILQQGIHWTSVEFNMKPRKIVAWIDKTQREFLAHSSDYIGQTISTLGGIFLVVFILPVYIFMILYYKPLLLEFIKRLFAKDYQLHVASILSETKIIIQSYLTGLLIEAGIIAAMNSIGLLILGIDYAILFGVIGALLNMIPYIGGIIAVALPMAMALATKDSPTSALMVAAVYVLIQFIDNHYIIPKVVASKVKINAFISILAVFVGGALWGISGTFLSIPIVAICKIIFDYVDSLKPWGYLLGDTMPEKGIKGESRSGVSN